MKVLVIEDDNDVSNYIAKGLKESGHIVQQAFNGEDGLFHATTENYDALIVDRMLPVIDGLALIKKLRSTGNSVPILILSALGNVEDRVQGLTCGADDYLVKPFAYIELNARLASLIRRSLSTNNISTELVIADLRLDLLSHQVKRANTVIELQSREFKLLKYLLEHQGQIVTRTMLLENVWEYNFDPQTNVIDVHISRLRNKIDKGFSSSLIKTVRGSGYIINE